MTTTHGGLRLGAGRKRKSDKAEYLRTPVAKPWSQHQELAMEWYGSLTPRDRLMYILELWFDCNCPNPKNRVSDIE